MYGQETRVTGLHRADSRGSRDIGQNRAEAHGQQQQGFVFLLNCQINQYQTYQDHHTVLPRELLKTYQQLRQGIHRFSPSQKLCC